MRLGWFEGRTRVGAGFSAPVSTDREVQWVSCLFPGGEVTGVCRWPPIPIWCWGQRKGGAIRLWLCVPSWHVISWALHYFFFRSDYLLLCLWPSWRRLVSFVHGENLVWSDTLSVQGQIYKPCRMFDQSRACFVCDDVCLAVAHISVLETSKCRDAQATFGWLTFRPASRLCVV
jgi:hypothetical protein